MCNESGLCTEESSSRGAGFLPTYVNTFNFCKGRNYTISITDSSTDQEALAPWHEIIALTTADSKSCNFLTQSL